MADETAARSDVGAGAERGPSTTSRDQRPWDLRLAWREHRPHVAFATGVFALGTVVGIVLALAEFDLLAALGLENVEELFEGVEFTAVGIFVNNTGPFFAMVAGALSLGLITAIILLFNGVFVGWVGTLVAGEVGIGPVLVLLAPHGVLELPALFVAAGIGFRLVHLAVDYLRGARERFLSKPESKRMLLLLLVAWVVLAIAAVVEVHVTPAIADAIYGDLAPAEEL